MRSIAVFKEGLLNKMIKCILYDHVIVLNCKKIIFTTVETKVQYLYSFFCSLNLKLNKMKLIRPVSARSLGDSFSV